MAKPYSELGKRTRKIPSIASLCSPKLFILLAVFAILFIVLLHIQIITSTFDFTHQWRKALFTGNCINVDQELEYSSMASKLQESVTFVPLKDLRYSSKPLQGHTWFMSSMQDTHEEGHVKYQEYPSKASKGKVLCVKGNDTHDGSWNSYALAWPHALPRNATLMKGITFVSYNHYNYDNIWHGLSAVVPFVAWRLRNNDNCSSSSPARWVLYHWGELRTSMGPWLSSLMAAAFGEPLNIEKFDGRVSSPAAGVCFERAVVMRHNEGGMSRERRLQVYDYLRCKARIFCHVSMERRRRRDDEIGMTMLMRTGPRSFKNQTAVAGIFREACRKVEGCRLTVAYAGELDFCGQVKLMGSTDVLVSPHGAQLTNMFLMDRNSSVMEFFPKGWLKLAGVGQYVYHWIASWSGMNHGGAWRDDTGGDGDGDVVCPFEEDDRRCMSVYKNARIGYDERYFSEWAEKVARGVKLRKAEQMLEKTTTTSSSCGC
ncbi:hypothetical protein ABFX02_02G055800 [Erythranthe guttata]